MKKLYYYSINSFLYLFGQDRFDIWQLTKLIIKKGIELMKIYRKIIISVDVLLCIVLTFLLFINHPLDIVDNEKPTQNDVKKLEEYSLTVSQTFDLQSITDKDISAEYHIEKQGLIVKIKSVKYGYAVESVYPISEFKLDTQKSEVKGIIDYKNVKHYHYFEWANLKTESKRPLIIFIFVCSLIMSAIIGAAIYLVFYELPKLIITIYRRIRKLANFK